MSSSDALNFSRSVTNIKCSSKSQILSCLQSLNEEDLKNVLLSMMFSKNTQFKSMIHNDGYLKMEKDANKSIDYIQNYFIENNSDANNSDSVSDVNNECKLIRVPSHVVAYIISFSHMYDTIKYQLICKDFYKICQISLSKQHLVVDYNFVKAMYNSSVDYTKYFNIKRLDLKFIFITTTQSKAKYGNFEPKYYAILSEIISKSPRLHTLKYDCDWYGTLNAKSVNQQYYRQTGYFKKFIDKLKAVLPNPFTAIQNLHISMSKSRYFWYWHGVDPQFNDICDAFPNLNTIAVNVSAQRMKQPPTKKDIPYCLLMNKFYTNKLKHIDINMNDSIYSWYDWTTRSTHYSTIPIEIHPLNRFYTVKNLQSINLVILLNSTLNPKYYEQLWSLANMQKQLEFKCDNLETVSLKFVASGNSYEIVETINQICVYVLGFCRKLLHYKFNVNYNLDSHFGCELDHLLGYFDNLQSLETNQLLLFPCNSLKLLSLKKFVFIDDYYSLTFDYNILTQMPNLSSLLIYNYKYNQHTIVENNKEIMKYLQLLTKYKSKYLKYVGIFADECVIKKFIKSKKGFICNKSESEKLCNLLILLTSSEKDNIETIELNSVVLKKKEMEYLYFWFENEYGILETTQYKKIRNNSCYLHLKCGNKS